MRYLMIPLRHLCTPAEEHAPSPAEQETQNASKRRSILRDVADQYVPSWCVSTDDMHHNVRIVEGPDMPEWAAPVMPAPAVETIPS